MDLESQCTRTLFLILKDFYSQVIRERFDERFPFRIDFYVPEKDLFIEYQGFWTHGKHPFDISSEKDLTILKKWRNLDQRIYTQSKEKLLKKITLS